MQQHQGQREGEFMKIGDILRRVEHAPDSLPHTTEEMPKTMTRMDAISNYNTPLDTLALCIQKAAEALHEGINILKTLRAGNKEPVTGKKIRCMFDGEACVDAAEHHYFIAPKTREQLSLQKNDAVELTITPAGGFFYKRV